MELAKLLTLSFPNNVGPRDRIVRILTGIGAIAAAALLPWPLGAKVALGLGGVLWALTGVLRKCSVYYLLGYSSCPAESSPPADRG